MAGTLPQDAQLARRSSQIDLEKEQRLGIADEREIGHLEARVRDPVVMPVDIEVNEAVSRAMRRQQIRRHGRLTHSGRELFPILVMFRGGRSYARHWKPRGWIFWFRQDAIGNVLRRKWVQPLPGFAWGADEQLHGL